MMYKYYQIILYRLYQLGNNLIYYPSLKNLASWLGFGLTVLFVLGGVYYVFVMETSYLGILIFTVSLIVSFIVHYYRNYSDNLFISTIQHFLSNMFILFICVFLLVVVMSSEIHCDGVDDVINTASQSQGSMDVVNNSSQSVVSSTSTDQQLSTSTGTSIEKNHVKISESVNDSNNKEYINFSVRKDILVKAGEMAFEKVLPNIGATAAGSALGGLVFKATAGLPMSRRIGLASGAIATGTFAGVVGLKGGDRMSKNNSLYDLAEGAHDSLNELVKGHPHSDPTIDRVPSPGPGPINSPLESGDMFSSPLEDLLGYSLILDYLILILVVLFLMIIFNRYIYNKNSKILAFILRLTFYGTDTTDKEVNMKVAAKVDSIHTKMNKFGDIFNFIVFVILTLLLLFNIFLSININSELLVNLDKYVTVYNTFYGIKKNFIMIGCSGTFYTGYRLRSNLIGHCENTFSFSFNTPEKGVKCYTTSALYKLEETKVNLERNNLVEYEVVNQEYKNESNTELNHDSLDLELIEKIKLFGSYETYLNKQIEDKVINDEFLERYYPNFKEDEFFIMFISQLNPMVRTEVEYVLDLYEYINKYNSLKDKIVILKDSIPEDLFKKLFSELKKSRKDLMLILKNLGMSEKVYNQIILNINDHIKRNMLLEKSLNFVENKIDYTHFDNKDELDLVDIINNQIFNLEGGDLIDLNRAKDVLASNGDVSKSMVISIWKNILILIKKDCIDYFDKEDSIQKELVEQNILKNSKEKFIELYTLLINIFNILKYIQLNSIKNIDILEWEKKINDEIVRFSKIEKFESYRIKKGELRKKRMSIGSVIGGYKSILIKVKNELESFILNYFNNLYSQNLLTKEFHENNDQALNKIQSLNYKIKEDFDTLYLQLQKAFDIDNFILSISKNLTDHNLNEQYNEFKYFYDNVFMGEKLTHNDLINLYKSFNKYNKETIRINEKELSRVRESTFSSNSFLYQKIKEILNDKNFNALNKQIMLERYILSYEKEFTLNIIKNMSSKVIDHKLLTRIYKHSTPQFINRINTFIDNIRKQNFRNVILDIETDNYGKLGDHVALALFLTIQTDQLVSILFSKVVRVIGNSGGITQNELLVQLSDEMLITFKYNIRYLLNKDNNQNNNILFNKLSKDEQVIVEMIYSKLDSLPYESKYKFGDILLELILEEFNYIFVKNNIYEHNEHFIYITITPEYLVVLTSSIFNPIRLPMISPPKEWKVKENYNEATDTNYIVIEGLGGYYLDEFNELSKNNNIVRQNLYNKYDSVVSKNQINTINFLNKIPFRINKTLLELIIKEWNNKENSSLFKDSNKLHPYTDQIDKVDSSLKKEIISHNSKFWAYSNIINIALLLKDQTIYFPTFLDFRGRVYPTPVYLSYQGSDLARSLLLFDKMDSEKARVETLFNQTLKTILEDELYSNKLIKKPKTKLLKLKDLDYFKLYLANMYGKSKLTRQGKISWANNNLEDMLDSYEHDYDKFKMNYLEKSKEPFQFLNCIISYYEFKKFNKEIRVPILFDASCSGIQHLSALTADVQIARLVNLLNNEEPIDFYQYCLDQIVNIIKNIPENSNKEIFKNKILQLNINRKWLKHCIMTIPYNVTSIGISDKIIPHFKTIYLKSDIMTKLENGQIGLKEIIELDSANKKAKLLNKSSKEKNDSEVRKGTNIYIPLKEIMLNKDITDLYFTHSDLYIFSELIRNTVLNVIPPFIQLKEYFDKIIEILKYLDLPVFWDTPSGMTVSMSNTLMKSKKIKTSLIKKAKPISILVPTEQIDYKKIKTGLMPNFIHSLDASNIHLLIKNLENIGKVNINLYTIHDCFASDYKTIALIELLVKHSFVELYFRKNYLKIIHESFLLQINSQKEIFEENVNDEMIRKFILVPNPKNKKPKKSELIKVYIPDFPDYNWDINKEKIYSELLDNSYFIS